MPRKIGTRDAACLGLLCLAFLLLAVQVALAGRGFHHPHGGLLGVLELPGRLLGWGAVALLAAAIPHVLLYWGGRARRLSATVLLGSVVFAIGIGGLFATFSATPQAGGGRLAGGVAQMLQSSLGTAFASVILALIAIPGALLVAASLAPQGPRPPTQDSEEEAPEPAWRRERTLAPAVDATEDSEAAPDPAPEPAPEREPDREPDVDVAPPPPPRRAPPVASPPPKARAWYPERKVGDDGTEIPMQFEGSDVGPIRYRDPEPAKPTLSETPATEGVAGKPPKAKTIRGVRFADEAPSADEPPMPGVRFHQGEDLRLPAGVRFADDPPPPPPPPQESEFADSRDATGDRAPPVRYEDVHPEPPPEPRSSTEPELASPEPPPPPPAAEPAAEAAAAPAAPTRRAEPPTPPAPRPKPRPKPKVFKPEPPPPPRVTSPKPAAKPPASKSPPPPPPRAKPPEPRAEKPAPPRKAEAKPPAKKASTRPEPAPEPPPPAAKKKPRESVDPRPAAAESSEPASSGAGRRDALYGKAVEAAIERGSASLVHLKRTLDVGYSRASALVEALVADGVLGEMTASGSRPTLITAEQWAKKRRGGGS